MSSLSRLFIPVAAALVIVSGAGAQTIPDSIPPAAPVPATPVQDSVRPVVDTTVIPTPPPPVVDTVIAKAVDSVGAPVVAKPAKPAAKRSVSGGGTAAAKRPAPVWPVKGPAPLKGSLLPNRRIIAYYGNPLSKRMGILGEIPPDSMLKRLDAEVAAWTAADSTTPAKHALHFIATVAQAGPGRDGKYRLRMDSSQIQKIADWAQTRNALVFLDVQVGLSTIEEEVARLAPWLKRHNFHLGLDPEFAMYRGGLPGKKIGTLDAKHINWTVDFLAKLVEEHQLPPKILVIHRFTRPMLTNSDKIELDPRVQIVVQMDGWGPPMLKRGSYRNYVWSEPVQFTGFKLFYKNDTKAGHPLMTPHDVLKLDPKPVYIQYQ